MWLQKTGRNTKRLESTLGAALALLAALAAGGCSAAYVEGNTSSVLLVVETIAGGAPLLSDVRDDQGVVFNCHAEVKVSTRAKNQIGVGPGPAEDVRVTRYSVSYRRSDGRGTQGLDVPYTISGNLAAIILVNESTTFSLDLVRHQAKLEPPLSNISGFQVVTMFADVTISGETISGKAVTASGSAQITFADFVGTPESCEG